MPDGLLRLRDGRHLSYHIAGPDDGLPLLIFHGWGGSRLTSHPEVSHATALGIRLITVDRPGVGFSDQLPGRTILDWPSDISTLADHLQLEHFALLGHSAGAPYALACAHHLCSRACSVTIVSGIGPPSSTTGKLFLSDARAARLLLDRASTSTKAMLQIAGGVILSPPITFLYRSFNRPFARDGETMLTPAMKDMRITSLSEAFRQGAEGLYDDAVLVLHDWGFSLSEVTHHVRLWHGEADTVVDVAFGRQLENELPNCDAVFHRNAGHHLLYIHWREILATVKDAA